MTTTRKKKVKRPLENYPPADAFADHTTDSDEGEIKAGTGSKSAVVGLPGASRSGAAAKAAAIPDDGGGDDDSDGSRFSEGSRGAIVGARRMSVGSNDDDGCQSVTSDVEDAITSNQDTEKMKGKGKGKGKGRGGKGKQRHGISTREYVAQNRAEFERERERAARLAERRMLSYERRKAMAAHKFREKRSLHGENREQQAHDHNNDQARHHTHGNAADGSGSEAGKGGKPSRALRRKIAIMRMNLARLEDEARFDIV